MAPKRPVADGAAEGGGELRDRGLVEGNGNGGLAARCQLGRVPFLVLAKRVNWLMTRRPPEQSRTLRFMAPGVVLEEAQVDDLGGEPVDVFDGIGLPRRRAGTTRPWFDAAE